MRVYVSSDIEGVAGVATLDHTVPSASVEYQRARRWMTAEVNAAVRAAFDAGAGDVWVNDAHGPNTNLLVEELDERVELLTGKPKGLNMVHGIDEGFDAALFLGYHARTGTAEAVLDHAYLGSVGFDLRLNGVGYGEFGLNAMLAGAFGVPVVMASGDDKLAAEARALLPRIEVATVKQALSRTAARTLTPAAARSEIAGAVRRALGGERGANVLAPPEPPFELDVTFLRTSMADVAAVMPGAERRAGRTVRWVGDEYVEVFRACRALLLLGATAL
ncbi:MAG: M55 family metallopeptidase [Trueperaceae bacterium]|nr:M55 family metallopeptidase [Trueperaceae bacterium]